jgi:hypothetical protein
MSVKEQTVTNVELPERESEFLLELLASAERELLAELSRTDKREYRVGLTERLALLESVRNRIIQKPEQAHGSDPMRACVI